MINTKCLLCDELVYASPKPETWGIQWDKGWVHYKCVQRLFEVVRAIQEADEMGRMKMINDKLEIGKPIRAIYTDESIVSGILRHRPSGEGDHFIIESDGILFSINPLSSTLDCLVQKLDNENPTP